MSQFKAVLARNVENQPDPVTVITVIAELLFLIFGIHTFRKRKEQNSRPIVQGFIILLISVGLFLIPILLPPAVQAFLSGRTQEGA